MHDARLSHLLPGPEGARREVRRPLLRRGVLDTHLLSAGVHREAAEARELPLLFNALFKQRYRLQPNQLRRHMHGNGTASPDALNFELSFRPPYDWPAVSAFLGARAIAGVEALEEGRYRRTARIRVDGKEHFGWIQVSLSSKKPALRVTVSASLAKALPPALSRVKALMDLSCNPTEVAQALGALAKHHPGLRVPGAFDGFEVAVRAILGQQVTVAAARTVAGRFAAARTVAGRFAAAFGDRVKTPFDALTMVFPDAERIAELPHDRIARLGMPGARARTVSALSRARWRTAISN